MTYADTLLTELDQIDEQTTFIAEGIQTKKTKAQAKAEAKHCPTCQCDGLDTVRQQAIALYQRLNAAHDAFNQWKATASPSEEVARVRARFIEVTRRLQDEIFSVQP